MNTIPNQTIDAEGLRARALAAVLLNDTAALYPNREDSPAFARREAAVWQALNADVARWLGATARGMLTPLRHPLRTTHDRMVDTVQL
jgi:hypothetical protein